MNNFVAPQSLAEFLMRRPNFVTNWEREHGHNPQLVKNALESIDWQKHLANKATLGQFMMALYSGIHGRLGYNWDKVTTAIGTDGEYVVIATIFDPNFPLCQCGPKPDELIPKMIA